jgi:hypothetical protein
MPLFTSRSTMLARERSEVRPSPLATNLAAGVDAGRSLLPLGLDWTAGLVPALTPGLAPGLVVGSIDAIQRLR